MKKAVVKAVYRSSKPRDKNSEVKVMKEGGLADRAARNQSDIYFNYFSERVLEKENDTWVKIYLPILKESAEDY